MKQILVTRSSMPSFEEYCNEIKELWGTHWLTNNGIKHIALENGLKDYLKVNNISLFTNGHLALETIITAMGLSGEIITTPFTFASTTNAIIRCGLKPVFCDIKEDDYTIDPKKIESLITDKTTAILPVHVYGNFCDYKEIQKIASAYNLKVLYDAAHAFAASIDGKTAGQLGDATMFSFHATKVFNTIEGGAVCCNDNVIKVEMEKCKNFGLNSEGNFDICGGNAKMNEFQAAMGICNLRHIDEEIAKREKAYFEYKKYLGNVNGIIFNKYKPNVVPNYAYLPILFNEYKNSRDEVFEKLKANGIISRKYFYPCTNDFKYIDENSIINKGNTPIAKNVANNVLCLPMYADLQMDDIKTICSIILD